MSSLRLFVQKVRRVESERGTVFRTKEQRNKRICRLKTACWLVYFFMPLFCSILCIMLWISYRCHLSVIQTLLRFHRGLSARERNMLTSFYRSTLMYYWNRFRVFFCHILTWQCSLQQISPPLPLTWPRHRIKTPLGSLCTCLCPGKMPLCF